MANETNNLFRTSTSIFIRLRAYVCRASFSIVSGQMIFLATKPPDKVYSGTPDKLVVSMHALELDESDYTLLFSLINLIEQFDFLD